MSITHAYTWAANGATVSGTDWNDSHVIDADGALLTTALTPPTTPAAGHGKLYARSIGGRPMLSFADDAGSAVSLQPHIGRNRVYSWCPQGINTTIAVIGGTITSAANTSRTPNFSGNLFTSMRRAGYVTAATVNSNPSARGYGLAFGFSSAPKAGGFHMIWRFGTTDYAADGRVFIGLGGNNSAYGSIGPGTMTNILGIGYDAGDTVWSVYYNDGTGTPTKVPTTFSCATLSTDVIEFSVFAPPGSLSFSYFLTRLNDGAVFPSTGPAVVTTDIPTSNLQPHVNVANGAGAGVVGIDLMSMYIETDN